jgi:hypothetical protein
LRKEFKVDSIDFSDIRRTELTIGRNQTTLAGLKDLQILNIEGPQVTDDWLDRMAAMKSLRQVIIGGAQVSEEAIARLHRSLPEVQIYVNGRPK